MSQLQGERIAYAPSSHFAFSVKQGSKSAQDIAQHIDTHSSRLAFDVHGIALAAKLITLVSVHSQGRGVIISGEQSVH